MIFIKRTSVQILDGGVTILGQSRQPPLMMLLIEMTIDDVMDLCFFITC